MNYTKSMNNNNKNMNSTNNKYYGFGDWLREDPKTKLGGFARDLGKSYFNYSTSLVSGLTGKDIKKPFETEDFNTDLGLIGNKLGQGYGNLTGKLVPTFAGMAANTVAPGSGQMVTSGMTALGNGIGNMLPEDSLVTNEQTSNTQNSNYTNYMNSFAFGGDYMNNKGNVPKKENNFTYYNAGGTHESNPYGGIPIGKQSFVEQGEFKFRHPVTREEYIFSSRF